MLEEFGHMFAQPCLHATVATKDLAIRTEPEAVVYVALKIFQNSSKADLRFGRCPARGVGGTQGFRRRTGV